MDASEIILRAIGAFYVFAGYAGARAGLMSYLLDVALAAITLKKPPRAEILRAGWLLIASTLVLAGGIALMLLVDWAAWLFVISAAGQFAYLTVAAPYYIDLEDPPDAKGRQQTFNAFILYAAATGFVAWAYAHGELQPLSDVHPLAIALAALALLAHGVYVTRIIFWRRKTPSGAGGESYDPPPQISPDRLAQSKRVQVMSEFERNPLWALDDGLDGDFPPELLNLSPELTRDLNEWAAAYQTSFNLDDPSSDPWSPIQRDAHHKLGRQLAERLTLERPDLRVCIMDETGFVDVPPPSGTPSR